MPFSSRRSKASGSPSSLDGLLGNVSVLERLDELRRRLVRSALAVCVGILVGFAFINQIVTFILGPTRRALPSGTRLIYTQPGEAFGLYIHIALIVGVVVAMPYLMYQLWQLVAPLVPATARRFTIPFVLFTTLGFIMGAAFTHFLAFPYMMAFFASFNTPDLLCQGWKMCSTSTRTCSSAWEPCSKCRRSYFFLPRPGSSRRGFSGGAFATRSCSSSLSRPWSHPPAT